MGKKRNRTTVFVLIFSITVVLIITFSVLKSFLFNSSKTPEKNSVSSSSVSSPSVNYGEVLQKAVYFYEAQRSGKLPQNNRVEWRGDSGLKDGSDRGIDLTGGWYDAGDHMKFGFPMAGSTTMLAWGVIEYEDSYKKSGQYNYMLDNLRWVNDYFIKAHPSPTVLWGQVGKGSLDHGWWGPAEVMPMERPAYKIDASCPGSDLAGETAAAMAASSIVFKKVDPNYSSNLLKHAKELYEFAEKYKGKYSDCITEAKEFYKSSGYNDELVWGAAWLYQATGDKQYLDKAEQYYAKLGDNPNSPKPYKWTQSWDDKAYGSYVLLAKITGKEKYSQDAERWLDYWTDKDQPEKIYYTPGGLAWLNEWGSLRYASNTAFLAFIYGDWVKTPGKQEKYHAFAEKQINYILGSNPQQRSYVVGFGNNPPTQPHHRTSHGSWANSPTIPEKTRHILYGALVGGPDKNDNYKDERSNYMMGEVTTDYNAAFTGAIAKMYSKYGGEPLAKFPEPEKRDDEFFVEANAKTGGNSTEIKAIIYNQSAWPARIIQNLSFRYFVDLSEVVQAGRSASDIQVNLNDKQGASISALTPFEQAKNIYYLEVVLDGSKLYPGGDPHYKKEVTFSLNSPVTGWNPDNDWSNQDIKNQEKPVKTGKIPIYDSGKLIFGAEPGNQGSK